MIWLKALPRLREIREKIYTQDELVDLVNAELKTKFTREWYTKIEQGGRSIKSRAATVISRALDAKLNEIFETEGN